MLDISFNSIGGGRRKGAEKVTWVGRNERSLPLSPEEEKEKRALEILEEIRLEEAKANPDIETVVENVPVKKVSVKIEEPEEEKDGPTMFPLYLKEKEKKSFINC